MFNFLKKVPLFANLPDDDLERLCSIVSEENISAGKMLFSEGELGDQAYVIMSGEIDILKDSSGQKVLLATRHTGEVIGEMSLFNQTTRVASGLARTNCTLLSISHDNLDHLLNTSPSAAKVMLTTIANRLADTELILRQSEKMAQLGTLTAGIAHELNNPASAAQRAAEHLQTSITSIQEIYHHFHQLRFTDSQWQMISELQDSVWQYATNPIILNTLERSDQEEILENWLEDHYIDNGWEYASIMTNMEYQTTDLEELERHFSNEQFPVLLLWLSTLFTLFSVLDEIRKGTSHIGQIVKALKTYSYLDQAPVQWIDVHESIENTLIVLRSKLSSGITVERQYAEDLPKIMAYASELNQVWTNLIDNAVDAMDDQGTLTIRTKREDDWIFVEFEDTGPGILEEIQSKLFSPFFTTKPVGKGTGLGLNISFNIVKKNKGEIKVFSQPGKTCFSVCLPINFEELAKEMKPLPQLNSSIG